jgi:hypothetical protein
MTTLIFLTDATSKTTISIRAKDVMACLRNPQNLLETRIMTLVMTAQGPLSYVVLESVEEVTEAVNKAMAGQNPGQPKTPTSLLQS